MMKLEDLLDVKREQVYSYMRSSRPEKYEAWIKSLETFSKLSPWLSRGKLKEPRETADTRHRLMEATYVVMRIIDDTVDGDIDLPEGSKNREDYVKEKIAFIDDPQLPKDENDQLLGYTLELAEKLGGDYRATTKDILGSLLFDARRVGKFQLFPEDQLRRHFDMLDISGTIKGSLQLFREDPEKHDDLRHLGMASRIYYNLRDLAEDVSSGYLNISQEDSARHAVSEDDITGLIRHSKEQQEKMADLRSDYVESKAKKKEFYTMMHQMSTGYVTGLPSSVKMWYKAQIGRGEGLIQKHHESMKHADMDWKTSLVLKTAYELPARLFLGRMRSILNH